MFCDLPFINMLTVVGAAVCSVGLVMIVWVAITGSAEIFFKLFNWIAEHL